MRGLAEMARARRAFRSSMTSARRRALFLLVCLAVGGCASDGDVSLPTAQEMADRSYADPRNGYQPPVFDDTMRRRRD